MYTCASCKIYACLRGPENRADAPKNCPTREKNFLTECKAEYMKPEINDFYINAGMTGLYAKEKKLPRIMEIVTFCKRMRYRHVGIAACIGSAEEADICARIFRKEGFQVDTVLCCAGGLNELEIGVPTPQKYYDDENFAIGCNPIGQAKLLEKAGTEFNVVLGLCVGHDSLFFKYSKAPCTVLTIKDRAVHRNPVTGIYCAYSRLQSRSNENEK